MMKATSPTIARPTALDGVADSPARSLWLDLRHIGVLIGSYVRSEPLVALALIAAQVVPLAIGSWLFLQTQLNVASITNALVARNGTIVPGLVATAVTLGLLALAFGVVGTWTRLILRIRFRRTVTDDLLAGWLDRDRFYHLDRRTRLDHPEQRIQEDVFQFIDQLLGLAPTVLGSLIALGLYTGQLWRLSPPLAPGLLGFEQPIPGLLVYIALASSILWTALTHWIGKALTRIEVVRQRLEAQFRQELGAIRENSESIAFARAGLTEHARVTGTFQLIRRNWRHYIAANIKIDVFAGLPETALAIGPTLFCIPYVLNGRMQIGDVAILGLAFRQVYNAIGIFVALYAQLAIFRSSVARLRLMHELLAAEIASDIAITVDNATAIRVHDLTIDLPDGSQLVKVGDLVIASGDRLVVQGRSGSGKSTLLRAIAGLWPYGHGDVTLPAEARVAFLPQRGYLPDGTLASLMSYPGDPGDHDELRYHGLLDALGLGALKSRLFESASWNLSLSPGEQQRIIAARAVLARPDFLFVDEATSALDDESERKVYALLIGELPDAALISVAHREAVVGYHQATLTLADGRVHVWP